MRVSRVHALEVLDSRGMPTLRVAMEADHALGAFLVPAGASTGKAEVPELRDGGDRYGGRGVRKAASFVEAVGKRLSRTSFSGQADFDGALDELDLPGNVSLGLSGAFARAGAAAKRIPLYRWFGPGRTLPRPMVNLFSGGLHGGGNMPIQDILVMPLRRQSTAHALESIWQVYQTARSLVAKRFDYLGNWVADEGGFAPRFKSVEQALKLAVESIAKSGLKPGKDMALCLDVAASHAPGITRAHLVRWAKSFPIVSIEDGVGEDDWDGWRHLTKQLGSKLQLVGDDLFATNPGRLGRGILEGCANAVLVKMNQIGTITRTLEVMTMAKQAGYATVVSARSGETEDSTMADLAVGAGGTQIKIGSIARGERLAKYNRLLEIEAELSAGKR
jgi:enolase